MIYSFLLSQQLLAEFHFLMDIPIRRVFEESLGEYAKTIVNLPALKKEVKILSDVRKEMLSLKMQKDRNCKCRVCH